MTRHSFSFGPHYDPGNLAFGALVCHNDDLVHPGGGYPDHPHSDLEIVTWVLAGALTHRDAAGRSGVIEPGRVQVMSAGTGVVHSETVEPGAGPTRFVQAWVRPDSPGGDPSYSSEVVDPGAGWAPVASGAPGSGALPIGAAGATLWVASVDAGDSLVLPEARRAHLFVATGSLLVPGVATGRIEGAGDPAGSGPSVLGEGDALRLTGEGLEVVAGAPGQLLLWTFA